MFISCISGTGEQVIVNAERIIDIYPDGNGVAFLYDRTPASSVDRPNCGKCYIPNTNMKDIVISMKKCGVLIAINIY